MSESKVPVTISHRAPGIQPPLYVAGSFSNPQWLPLPMEYTSNEDGIYTFTKTFEVVPKSKITYKYRVGEGDWWILDETAPTVTDDAGNRNNFLEAPEASVHDTQETSISQATGAAEATPLEESDFPAEPAEESAYKPTETPVSVHESVAEPVESKTDERNHDSIEDTLPLTSAGTQQLQPLSAVETLKHSEQIGRQSTPEIAAEVADTAALLDCPTPEPEASDETAGKLEEEQPATILERAAEADIAAEVADSAEKLDADEPEAPLETEPSPVVHAQDTAEVAAEVADTASTLDVDESEVQSGPVPPAYQSLAEVKADMKDDSLDIAGFSNDPEPVPLFAHECAGLYEDDEIPGAEDAVEEHKSNGLLHERRTEDYDDPTLEKFPSNKDEIISAVRKVETGLNADQTTVDGVPPSPIVKSRQSSVTDVPSDRSEPDSPTLSRGQQSLSLPAPLAQQSLGERSLSASSLHSIAEDVEGDEAEKFKTENLSAVVDRAQASEEPIEKGSKHEYMPLVTEPVQIAEELVEVAKPKDEEKEDSTAREIAPVVEQPETADEVVQSAEDTEKQPSQETVPTTEEVPPIVEVAPVAEQIHLPVVEQKNVEHDQNLSKETDGQGLQKSKAEEIAPQVEKAETADEAIRVAKEAEGDATLAPHKPTLEPLITIPTPSAKPSKGLLSPISDDDEAVVLKNGENNDRSPESAAQSGYLTPERATTPKPEEPDSPREPPPNIADPNLEKDVPEPSSAPAPSVPRSPQIVVSKAEETQPEEELLPVPSLEETHVDEIEAPKPVEDAPKPVEDAPKSIEEEDAPKSIEEEGAPKPVEEGAPKPVEEAPKSIAEEDASKSVEEEAPKSIEEPLQSVDEEALKSVDEEALKSIDEEEAPKSIEEPSKSVDEEGPKSIDEEGPKSIEEEEAPKSIEEPSKSVDEGASKSIDEEGPKSIDEEGPKSIEEEEAPKSIEEAPKPVEDAPKSIAEDEAPKSVEAPLTNETASLVNGSQDSSSRTETAATSSALDESQTGSLKQRSVAKPNPAERTDTPTSITDTHREAAKSGNWFSAFFRLIFIDLVGGFVSRLCGGRRKTLVTTVVVLASLGIASYRRASEAERQAD